MSEELQHPCRNLKGRLRNICQGIDLKCRGEDRRKQIQQLLDLKLIPDDPDDPKYSGLSLDPSPEIPRAPKPKVQPTKYLGDHIESALTSVGITKQAVEKFLGAPCNCTERQEKFNQLDKWARAVLSGAVGNAKGFLEKIFRGESKMPSGN